MIWPFRKGPAPPEEPPQVPRPPTRIDVDAIVRSAAELRDEVLARIRQVVKMTERDTLAAGDCVMKVVDTTSEQASGLHGLSGDGTTADVLAERQLVETGAFLSDICDGLTSVVTHSEQQVSHAADIQRASAQIAAMTTQAGILAINAQIEAARAGVDGGGFAVLAHAMRQLSDDIAKANAAIEKIAKDVTALSPLAAQSATQLRQRTTVFVAEFRASAQRIADVRRAELARLQALLEASDDKVREVNTVALKTLSHLQFQDTVSQNLLRLDARLRDHEVEILQAAGRAAEAPFLRPPVHEELGGEKPLESKQAGDVQFL